MPRQRWHLPTLAPSSFCWSLQNIRLSDRYPHALKGRNPARRPGGFEIRRQKMFDLLNRGLCNPPHLASSLLAADFKSADPKKVRTFFYGGFQIRRDAWRVCVLVSNPPGCLAGMRSKIHVSLFRTTCLKYPKFFILSLLFLSFFLIFVLFFKNTNFNLIIFRDNENKTLEN